MIAALVVAVLGVPAVMVGRERGGGLGSATDRRDDLAAARPSPRLLVLDGLLVALAVIGVVLLRERGASAGTDPLVAAVPVLLGAALGALVLRAYPYLLRATGPVLRRRSGAVAFLGLARASRQNLVGALPLAVLLLAATVAGFTATVDTGLRDGQVRASWWETGADARIEAGPVDDATLARIRSLPGDRRPPGPGHLHGVDRHGPGAADRGRRGPGRLPEAGARRAGHPVRAGRPPVTAHRPHKGHGSPDLSLPG